VREAKSKVVGLITRCAEERLWYPEMSWANLDEDFGFEKLLG
jgi:hypothetical protein